MKRFPRNDILRRQLNTEVGATTATVSTPAIQLPNEILLNIFKYVGPHDLLFSLSMVCKRWRILCHDLSLWRTCTISNEDINGDNLSLLALAPTLRAVCLNTTLPSCQVARALLHGNKDLNSLQVHFQHETFTSTELKAILHRFQNLEHIDLRLPPSLQEKALLSAFCLLQKLQSMQLSGILSPISELLNAINLHCRALHTLHLIDCFIAFRDEHLFALVSDGRPWRSLKLMTYFISEEAYECFAGLQHLEELALIKCKKLMEDTLCHIVRLPKMQSLTLSENCILSSSGLAFCFQSDSLNWLQEISLTIYRIDDSVALAIAMNCSLLMHLRLAMCLLSDDGVRSIILNAPHLVDLDLESNVIRGQWLHLIPKHLPNLTSLNLRLCYNVLVNLENIVANSSTLRIIDPTGNIIAGTCAKCLGSKERL